MSNVSIVLIVGFLLTLAGLIWVTRDDYIKLKPGEMILYHVQDQRTDSMSVGMSCANSCASYNLKLGKAEWYMNEDGKFQVACTCVHEVTK